MRRIRTLSVVHCVAAIVLSSGILFATAHAGPLSADEKARPQGATPAHPLTAAELALADPNLESAPELGTGDLAAPLRRHGKITGPAGAGRETGLDMFYGLNADSALSTATFCDALRGLVNVQAGSAPRKGAPPRRGNAATDEFGLALGVDTRELIQGAVNDIVDSVLRPSSTRVAAFRSRF